MCYQLYFSCGVKKQCLFFIKMQNLVAATQRVAMMNTIIYKAKIQKYQPKGNKAIADVLTRCYSPPQLIIN